MKRQVWQYLVFFNLNQFALDHGRIYVHTWIDLAKRIVGEDLRFIKKSLRILHSCRVHTLG